MAFKKWVLDAIKNIKVTVPETTVSETAETIPDTGVGQSETGQPQSLGSLLGTGNKIPGTDIDPTDAIEHDPTFGLVTLQDYGNHKFRIFTPLDVKNSGIYGASMQGAGEFVYANFTPEYNFNIPKYEELSSRKHVSELVLPNLYVLEAVRNVKQSNNGPLFRHATLSAPGPLIKTAQSPIVNYEKSDEGFLEKKIKGHKKYIQNQDYYDSWNKNIDTFIKHDAGSDQPITEKMKNVVVPIKNVGWLADKAPLKELYPYTVEIEFTTDTKTEIADILEEAKLSRSFMQLVYGSPWVPKVQSHIEVVTPGGNKGGGKVQKRLLNHWDVGAWFDNLTDAFENLDPTKDFAKFKDVVYLGTGGESMSINQPIVKALHAFIFKSKFNQLISAKTRTNNQALAGVACYSETVFYRIEKRDGANKLIQNYWIPNSSNINVMKFVDSQVKYFKSYKYKIYAYQLVIGDNYGHTDQIEKAMGGSIWLCEILYAQSDEIIISDKPPLPPEVTILP